MLVLFAAVILAVVATVMLRKGSPAWLGWLAVALLALALLLERLPIG